MSARVEVSAGRGPWEVRRFVALLARQTVARLAAEGLVAAVEAVHGEPEAPASVVLRVDGDALAALSGWLGTHELRAASPRRGKRSRQRWFAGVLVSDVVDAPATLRLEDMTVRTCRAGGPGGQHVNTSDTAVQVVHRPTGLSIRASDERSQAANRRLALQRLERALAQRAEQATATDGARRHANRQNVVRGAAVRRWRCDDRWTQLQEAG